MRQNLASRVFSEEYRITSYLVNLRQRLGLYGALNLIQDVGWQHAVQLGLRFSEEGLAWVFTRQKLVMRRWPEWNERLTIRTWLRNPGSSPFVFRDYLLLVGEEKLGECTSSFTLMDAATRKLAKPDWSKLQSAWNDGETLHLSPEKIPLREHGEELATFEVRNSDLDLNFHVNNTKYAQWVLDSVSLEELRSVDLHEYEVNFLAETRKSDEITLFQWKDGPQFQGVRRSDGKTVFSVRMKVSPSPSAILTG